MRFGPPVRFARRPDGHNIAYQVFGDAELDLVFLLGYATHLGLLWEDPSVAGFLHKLGSFSRLILLDRLGSGLSDRGPTDQAFEDDMDDVALVLDAVGSQRTALFGCALGGRLALLFAATYPERTSAVVAFSAHPASMRDEDFPWGSSQEQREQLSASIRGGSVGLGDSLSRMAPHEAADPSFRHLVAGVPPVGGHAAGGLPDAGGAGSGGHPPAARLDPRANPAAAPDRGPVGGRAHQPLHGRADSRGQAGGVARRRPPAVLRRPGRCGGGDPAVPDRRVAGR
jgi:pimeloyl-ACP methyl ester carboxylesterase